MTTISDNHLHFDLIQLNERLITLEVNLEKSLRDLTDQFHKNKQEMISLQNKISRFKSQISNKFKNLEDKTTSVEKLDAIIGKTFPLKHDIMQDKFTLNEECSRIIQLLSDLIQKQNNIGYKIQEININLQSLKAIRSLSMQLEKNLGSKISPEEFMVSPTIDYQPLYMIQEVLDKLNEYEDVYLNDSYY
ncbi:hypothetical protein [Natranaerofaba carboxydovora]|uniref:hypothetical protein n=1 Tax=Natranaerofaba carboxydovora TaxID=2742683 RepID=UPI001F145FE4|nr:hypothetical protein [Natranaerofaba carboxydovora]UMZ72639.1 hypothetical protein ACONDI_00163 [Natranaerofaba carboxydovora]